MNKKILLGSMVFVLACAMFNIVHADDITIDTTNVNSGDRVQPVQGDKTYIFDEAATKTLLKQKGGLIKIICNPDTVKRELGLTSLAMKFFSIGIEKEGFEYTFDFKNCSIYGNRVNANYSPMTMITEDKALAMAKKLMDNSGIKTRSYNKIGEPIITYKNNGGGYPMMGAGGSDAKDFTDIEIDKNDKGENAGYVSMSIMFPYTLNGKKIYNQYGGQLGITMEVNAEGVNNLNVPLMSFKGALRNSDKMSDVESISYIKRGGNNQFRGTAKEIKLSTPERIFIYGNVWRNNANEVYIGGGIRFGSDVKPDMYAQQNYEMIISDYKLFNTNGVY